MPQRRASSRIQSTGSHRTPAQPSRPLGEPAITPSRDEAHARFGRLMLPLRVFLGVTFVYAGLVKLVDPAFLDPTAHGSLVEQLHAFARESPLAPLITDIGIPLAIPIGLLIAIGELAVGVGALTGLAAPLAAWAGFVISTLFFLTASWGIHPYFLGPDLPYAAGWLTFALAGDGGLYVLRGRVVWPSREADDLWASERRIVLQSIALGGLALALGAVGLARPSWLAGLLGTASNSGLAAGSGSVAPSGPGAGLPTPSGGPAAGAGSTPGASAPPVTGVVTPGPATPAIATVSAVSATGSATFVIPASGDPGVLVRLASGTIVAFDAVCTHAGCTVEYVPQNRDLECPCHGAAFDPANGGAVLAGPTSQPLLTVPITIDQKTGEIRLSGQLGAALGGSPAPGRSPAPRDTAPHLAPDLEALLPSVIDETALAKASATGDTVLNPSDPTGQSWIAFLSSHGKKPSDFRIAQAADPTNTLDIFVAVFQVAGLDSGVVRQALIDSGGATNSEMTTTSVTLGGRSVTKVAYVGSSSYSYVYAHANDVFDIQTGNETIATQLIQLLP
jgi:thiosulfate dehydrogenase (quinone) large subunit